MKHGQKKTPSEQRHDFKSLQEHIDRWKLPSGPFDWQSRGKAVSETHQFYNETFQLLKRNPYDAELSKLNSRAHELWSMAIGVAYPSGFWNDYARLRSGDAAGMESAVQFLEADPIFYRTGYIKAKMARYIKPDMIAPPHSARLRSVLLSVVDRRDDRDFRAFSRLARKVDSPELRQALVQRLNHTDANVRRRARWTHWNNRDSLHLR